MNFLFKIILFILIFWGQFFCINFVMNDPNRSLIITSLFFVLIFIFRFLMILYNLKGVDTSLFWDYERSKKPNLGNVKLQKKKVSSNQKK